MWSGWGSKEGKDERENEGRKKVETEGEGRGGAGEREEKKSWESKGGQAKGEGLKEETVLLLLEGTAGNWPSLKPQLPLRG